jgi:preprotein translocase subunit SecG
MVTVILVIHCMLAIALIGIVLIQRSEGGGLGIGGSSGGGMSGFMTGRSQANLLTRTTGFLAAGFMITSISLAILHARAHGVQPSLLDQIPLTSDTVEGKGAAPVAPASVPAGEPSVPLAK